jgi:hypothetical protein
MRFKVKTPEVIHQAIDGEVIIISLETGNYYSTAGTGAEVWSSISSGASLEEITGRLATRYEVDENLLASTIEGFMKNLSIESLIVPAEGEDAASAATAEPIPSGSDQFEPLVLEKFDDMQDLILLDPVHEVGEYGWPHATDRVAK